MKKAFTLIELLIVVAIIAILAAIAVPNFLEAQTRSKVTRCKSDMRTISVALESYMVDWNKFPFDGSNAKDTAKFSYWHLPYILTTPIAYTTIKDFTDPFVSTKGTQLSRNLRYVNTDATWNAIAWSDYSSGSSNGQYVPLYESQFGKWRLSSYGPDGILSNGSQTAYNPPTWYFLYNGTLQTSYEMNMPYDPTNGTKSYGDIIRTQKNPEGYGK